MNINDEYKLDEYVHLYYSSFINLETDFFLILCNINACKD